MCELEHLKPGLVHERRAIVTPDMVTTHVTLDSKGVLTTAAMFTMMEMAGQEAVQPYLPPEHTTVGYELHIRHLASAPLGAEVRARAELLKMQGRKLRFKVEAYHGDRKIGEGTHVRAIVRVGRLATPEQC
ncbi:MAG: thioesterase [Nitrospinae bacterium]|nr:thioesterase [Nitrospinota bacterium]